MATISDSSIMSMAQGIVTDFIDKKVSLNEGITKKAAELSLNADQTKRLIERTNTEAFLRQYPETTEFEVASPEVILGVKVASEPSLAKVASKAKEDKFADDSNGLFKAASAKSEVFKSNHFIPTGGNAKYNEKVASVTDEDIFGLNTEEFKKEASACGSLPYAIDQESKAMSKALADINKTASEIEKENNIKEIEFGERLDDISDFIKQASLSGEQSIKESEAELLNNFPDNRDLIVGMYDAITEKLASEYVSQEKLERAERLITKEKLANTDTPLSNKFAKIVALINS